MLRFKISMRNHGFIVKSFYFNDTEILKEFNKKYQTWKTVFNYKLKRNITVPDKEYVISLYALNTFGYHKNLYNELMEYLKSQGINESDIEIHYAENYQAEQIKITLNPDYQPRNEIQIKAIGHICSSVPPLDKTAVLPLQTGMGKTFSTLRSIERLGVRVSIIGSKRYLQTWFDDIEKFYLDTKDIYLVIDSAKSFKKVIEDAQNKKLSNKVAIIIFSVNIMASYLKEYQETGMSSYGCLPEHLYQTLGVGIRVTDEAHEDTHFQFRHDILTHVNKAIYLSATLKSYDAFKNKIYKTLYPLNTRLQGIAWKKYITGVALGYSLKDPRKAEYMGPKGYSHTKYEQWIMSNKIVFQNYVRMVHHFVEKGFVSKYQPNQKLLVYMSTIEMCDYFAKYLEDNLSLKHLKISSFVQLDEADVLIDNDILVSTPSKSGTGKNIEGLVVVISTIAIKSMESNTQTSGRLREIDTKFPGVEPTFYYLVCNSIEKHRQFHNCRIELFTEQFAKLLTYNTNFVI